MLQQTQVKTVLSYWPRWMQAFPSVERLARARPEKVLKLWEGLGYYTRARNLHQAAKLILEKYNGRFPTHFEDILALPGIGRYTAGAISSAAFNQPTPILDGNVARVLSRVFGIGDNSGETRTKEKLWALAGQLVRAAACNSSPAPGREKSRLGLNAGNSAKNKGGAAAGVNLSTGNCSALNQAMMELGALICTPRKPACPICPLQRRCFARCENRVGDFPNPATRPAATARRFVAFVIEQDGLFLVRQRPAGVVNAQLWEFPNVEATSNRATPNRLVKQLFGNHRLDCQPFCHINHTITRFRIDLEVFRLGPTGSRSAHFAGQWRSFADLQRLPFPSAHRKIIEMLGDWLDRTNEGRNPINVR
jgi:A/G-specific adenine glycosylase